jgi:hypothetical protein
LKPLTQDAARCTFIDIADDAYDTEDIDKILPLTGNMPLAIDLMAHLVDSEGCSNVLSRWEQERTSMISKGYDKQSNLDLSISLSLSSPRITSFMHSQALLGVLSLLPDGFSDTELLQSNLPIDNVLSCKADLIRISLAYSDERKRTKILAPIREYVQKVHPISFNLVRLLLKYFQELLEVCFEYFGTLGGPGIVTRIITNFRNIQNVLLKSFNPGHPDLGDIIYCICRLAKFSRLTGTGRIALMMRTLDVLPVLYNPRLVVYFTTELFHSWRYYQILNPKVLIDQALKNFHHINDARLQCKFF